MTHWRAETARLARQSTQYPRWRHAAQISLGKFFADLIARDNAANRGRPLDMGGPRDIWLEQSPWDDR